MTTINEMNESPVILTKGMYDLLKDHIRRKKLSKLNEAELEAQLRKATQVVTRDLPPDVVAIGTMVTVQDTTTGEQEVFKFLAPDRARKKNGTVSILSPMGLAMVGYPEGATVQWEFEGRMKTYEIVSVSRI
ncbi:GreA/GreB family elongation factor [Pedobacter faecalis]|uniref:GreA/GreB family elongation factor n=1 Tax=Pedobacter faecalis TaxID=3041495 RepID=UPI00254B5218|nr:GreA/GreB family elongation factor [Pedobacter sp. ELA7]